MIEARLGGRGPWLALVSGSAGTAGALGLVAGLVAIAGSSAVGGGGAIGQVVGSLACLTGIGAATVALGSWFRRHWAHPLGLVVAPAYGAVAALYALFVDGGLLSPVTVVGVGLAALIFVGLERPEVRGALGADPGPSAGQEGPDPRP